MGRMWQLLTVFCAWAAQRCLSWILSAVLDSPGKLMLWAGYDGVKDMTAKEAIDVEEKSHLVVFPPSLKQRRVSGAWLCCSTSCAHAALFSAFKTPVLHLLEG